MLGRLDPNNQICNNRDRADAVFRGVYQGQPQRRAVVRSGAGLADEVTMSPGVRLTMVAGDHQESTRFDAPEDVLIVTGAGDDIIQTESP